MADKPTLPSGATSVANSAIGAKMLTALGIDFQDNSPAAEVWPDDDGPAPAGTDERSPWGIGGRDG